MPSARPEILQDIFWKIEVSGTSLCKLNLFPAKRSGIPTMLVGVFNIQTLKIIMGN